MTTTQILKTIGISISSELSPHWAVCEFSSEDTTPTLHIDLWRGFSFSDLPAQVANLKIVAEGYWDGGRSYSLQFLSSK